MADGIRVLIVDDHVVVREGLRSFLELQEGIEVIGAAGDGAEALDVAQRLSPDVVLMDLVMPRLDGVEAMRRLRELVPRARVIVLTSFLDDERLMPAIRAGAAGYLLKNAQPQEVARAIHTAHDGEALIDPAVAARLVGTLAEGLSGGGDLLAEVVLLDRGVGPEHLHQLRLLDHPPALADERQQRIERFWRQRDRIPRPEEPPALRIDRELIEFQKIHRSPNDFQRGRGRF